MSRVHVHVVTLFRLASVRVGTIVEISGTGHVTIRIDALYVREDASDHERQRDGEVGSIRIEHVNPVHPPPSVIERVPKS